MRNGFRQSMAWLHTWSGLVVGWVLFAVFVTGTASYYRAEISLWMRPELREAAEPDVGALGRAADHGLRYLKAHAGDATGWSIGMPRPDFPLIELHWRSRPGPPTGHALLDPETGAPAQIRDTKGGEFFYRFHFELHMPPLWGRWIVGICSLVMLVALISGIVTHRRIFADFFTLRRAKSAQRGWLDAHNVVGVLGLPYHLMITYTGLVTFALMYMPWGVSTAYQGNAQRFYSEAGQILPPREPAGRPGELVPLDPLIANALARVPHSLERVTINHPRDANATVLAIFEEPHGLSHVHPQIAFDGITGALLTTTGEPKPAAQTWATLVGLHEAHFAGPTLRVLFFLSGLMGCAMVATGLILWGVARAPKTAKDERGSGLRLVAALNIGTVAGLPAGIACYFLANRLLPLWLPERALWEVRIFFAAWLLVAVVSLGLHPQKAWRDVLMVVAFLFLAVPVVNGLTTGRHALASAADGDGLYLWFDAAMLALAAACTVASSKVSNRPDLVKREVRQRALGAMEARSSEASSPPSRTSKGLYRMAFNGRWT